MHDIPKFRRLAIDASKQAAATLGRSRESWLMACKAERSRSLYCVSTYALESKVDKLGPESWDLSTWISKGETPLLFCDGFASSSTRHSKTTVPSVPEEATSCKSKLDLTTRSRLHTKSKHGNHSRVEELV